MTTQPHRATTASPVQRDHRRKKAFIPENPVLERSLEALRDEYLLLAKLNALQAKTIATLLPKARKYDESVDKERLVSIVSAAKTFGETRGRLWRWMREDMIILSDDMPDHAFIATGVLAVRIYNKIMDMSGVLLETDELRHVTFVTPKGVAFLAARYGANGTHTRLEASKSP